MKRLRGWSEFFRIGHDRSKASTFCLISIPSVPIRDFRTCKDALGSREHISCLVAKTDKLSEYIG
jgi:hypothetical protein